MQSSHHIISIEIFCKASIPRARHSVVCLKPGCPVTLQGEGWDLGEFAVDDFVDSHLAVGLETPADTVDVVYIYFGHDHGEEFRHGSGTVRGVVGSDVLVVEGTILLNNSVIKFNAQHRVWVCTPQHHSSRIILPISNRIAYHEPLQVELEVTFLSSLIVVVHAPCKVGHVHASITLARNVDLVVFELRELNQEEVEHCHQIVLGRDVVVEVGFTGVGEVGVTDPRREF